MLTGVPTFRLTTKSALYWVGASASGLSLFSSAGAVNKGLIESRVNKPTANSLFMIRSYNVPDGSARAKKTGGFRGGLSQGRAPAFARTTAWPAVAINERRGRGASRWYSL